MKSKTPPLFTFFVLFIVILAMNVSATVRYVDSNSTNAAPPHTSWSTAATNIQQAIDAAVAGDEIVVTNGIYATGGRATVDNSTTSRVAVDKPVTLRSANGPQSTIIDGGGVFRCVYLTNGAGLSGFTLTNGIANYGGGLWCEAPNVVVSNCVVAGNSASTFGGGASGGTLNNCMLSSNSVFSLDDSFGGGAYGCILNNCALTGNSARGDGGGASYSTLNNCTLTGNSATYGGGAYGCELNNCTLSGNSAANGSGGAHSGRLNNCIVYFNAAQNYDSSSTLNYSCTTPQPNNGLGNITNAPLFVDFASRNLHLQSNSPCINGGRNAFAPAGLDLDGNPRIMGDTVDIGAYEFQSPTWVAPQLIITSSGANVVLSWSATYAFRYILQAATNLAFSDGWTAVSPEQVVVNGQNAVTNSISATEQFYRLTLRCPNAGPAPSPDPHWYLSRDSCTWIFSNGPGGGN